MPTPKFKIGQSVYLKDDVDYYVASYNRQYDTYGNPRPRSITVIAIMTEECSGGTQIFYRFIQSSGWVAEIGLVSELPFLSENK